MDGAQDVAHSRYDADFLIWSKEQAAAIRARDWAAVDWDHVAEEIESLGISERNELENRITTIIEHLLKLEYGQNREPEKGWRQTILTQQSRIERLLRKVPSLVPTVSDVITAEYTQARRDALRSFAIYEPGVDYEGVLPVDCPFGRAEVLG